MSWMADRDRYQREQQERSDRIRATQWEQGTELENLLKLAETDLESARIVEMARLLRPEDFRLREEGFERVRQMRMSRRGNDPDYQSAIQAHESSARNAIGYAVKKAKAVLALVRSWEAEGANPDAGSSLSR